MKNMKKIGCIILLAALIINFSVLKGTEKSNHSLWDDVIKLTKIESDINISSTVEKMNICNSIQWHM